LSRVIILNGVGSAGKSSLARALQAVARDVFLHVPMDSFLDMMPGRTLNHPDGLTFEHRQDAEGHPVVIVRSGPALRRAMRGMRHAIAAMADQGNELIVDEVVLGGEWAEYERLLAGHQVTKVGVLAPLDVLEAREKARGDRDIGLARAQFDLVHRGAVYDVTVDTSSATPEECAETIRVKLGL
jgi:chloramphenicol 3-O phosphotransferase